MNPESRSMRKKPPSSIKPVSQEQLHNLRCRLVRLYGEDSGDNLLERLHYLAGRYGVEADSTKIRGHWNENDVILITYGDKVRRPSESPLHTLKRFCCKHLEGLVSMVHILPFYPWSSDDGFSVINYREVDADLGDWGDVEDLGKSFDLMFDLVLNHCSSQSGWFRDFQVGIEPARHYFVEMDPETDLSQSSAPAPRHC